MINKLGFRLCKLTCSMCLQGSQQIQDLQNMARHQSLLVENHQALLLQTSRISSHLQEIAKKPPVPSQWVPLTDTDCHILEDKSEVKYPNRCWYHIKPLVEPDLVVFPVIFLVSTVFSLLSNSCSLNWNKVMFDHLSGHSLSVQHWVEGGAVCWVWCSQASLQ